MWWLLCVRDELEIGTDCYIDPEFFFDHSSTSFSSWLGCSTVGHWGSQALCLQADSHAGILSPTDSNRPGHLVILLSHTHLLQLFFRLFTQVHVLIDGSVKGQSIRVPPVNYERYLVPQRTIWLSANEGIIFNRIICSILETTSLCCILTFDPAKLAITKWCTGRKWQIPMALMRRNRVGGLG